MPLKVARKAIQFSSEYLGEESFTIGGGEPTLHPYFWTILGECLGSFDSVWMATNGSQTNIALKLANMAKKGILGVALSQDIWHDEIDERVVIAFTKKNIFGEKNYNDYREIRTVNSLSNVGRAKLNNLDTNDSCPCEDWMIKINGDIRQCGCPDAPIFGNLLKNSFDEIYDKMRDNDGEGHFCCNSINYVEKENETVKELIEA